MLAFLTREFWEFLIIANIVVGGVWALIRLRRDLTRPTPPPHLDAVRYRIKTEVGASPRTSEESPDTTDE